MSDNIDNIDNIGLFDLDGSLADYDFALMYDMNSLRSPEEPEITNLRTLNEKPYLKARMRLIKSQPNWWANLPPIEKGAKVLSLARTMGFDCKVLTKGPKSHSLAWKEKLDWVFHHLGEDTEVTITFDKGSVYGKFLYDDYLDYNMAWLKHRPRGLVIMPVEKLSGRIIHPNILEYDGTNLDQVRRALWFCWNRRSGEELVIPR